MSAYRGKTRRGYLYVQATGRRALRACGTADRHTVRAMKRMLADLRARRQWDLLEAVIDRRLDLGALYDAYALERLDHVRQQLQSVDIASHVDGWLADYLSNGKSASNAPIYRAQVRSLLGDTFLSHELTPARVAAWLRGADISSGSKRNRLMALRSFVRYCVRMGILAVNPIRDVETPKKNPPTLRWEPEAVDLDIVAQAGTPQLAALFAFVHGTGADLSPVLERTERRDIDLTRRVTVLRGTKTAKRTVHEAIIPSWAIPALEAYLRGMMPHVRPWAGLSRYQAAKHHAQCAEAAGVPGYTLRMARHSVAVRARQAGLSFEWIAAQLGNSVYQVATVYARFEPTTTERLSEEVATDLATRLTNHAGAKRA